MIHDVNHMHKSVNEQGMNSVLSAKCTNRNCANQYLEECKSLPSHSHDMLQPLLADLAKPSLQGNKNKTGSFGGESIDMEERDNDSAINLTEGS